MDCSVRKPHIFLYNIYPGCVYSGLTFPSNLATFARTALAKTEHRSDIEAKSNWQKLRGWKDSVSSPISLGFAL